MPQQKVRSKILNPISKANPNASGKTFSSVSTILIISERAHTIQDCTYFTFFTLSEAGKLLHFNMDTKRTLLDEAFRLWLLLTYNVIILHPKSLHSNLLCLQLGRSSSWMQCSDNQSARQGKKDNLGCNLNKVSVGSIWYQPVFQN